MSIFEAIVLGLVQGLSEFLPISSSGHLVLTRWLLGWDPQADSWILWSKPEPLLKWLYLVPVFPGPAGWTWDQTAELAPTFTTGQPLGSTPSSLVIFARLPT